MVDAPALIIFQFERDSSVAEIPRNPRMLAQALVNASLEVELRFETGQREFENG